MVQSKKETPLFCHVAVDEFRRRVRVSVLRRLSSAVSTSHAIVMESRASPPPPPPPPPPRSQRRGPANPESRATKAVNAAFLRYLQERTRALNDAKRAGEEAGAFMTAAEIAAFDGCKKRAKYQVRSHHTRALVSFWFSFLVLVLYCRSYSCS